MYDCVIFDIDGTILDTREASLLAVQQAYKIESGKLLPIEELEFSFGVTTREMSRVLNVKNPDRFIAEIDRQYDLHSDRNRVFPGLLDLIRSLHKQNIYLGIVTSKTIWEYQHDFDRFQLEPYFGRAMCVEHTQKHKPDPEPLNMFFLLTGMKPQKALYIGDNINDSLCARAAGVDFALATWGTEENIPSKYYPKVPGEILNIVQNAPSSFAGGRR
jgi:HAD superfamily hydrolase (TIGR01549 family)